MDSAGRNQGEVRHASHDARGPPGAAGLGITGELGHDALSVRIARAHAFFESAHDPELVLWLIGTHHGYGRPMFPHCDALEDETRTYRGFAPNLTPDQTLALDGTAGPHRLDFSMPVMTESGMCSIDWPTMFERLQRRYGPWGLAWLESIVRLADHRASERSAALREVAKS